MTRIITITGIAKGNEITKECEVKRDFNKYDIMVITWNGKTASFDGRTVYRHNITLATGCRIIDSIISEKKTISIPEEILKSMEKSANLVNLTLEEYLISLHKDNTTYN